MQSKSLLIAIAAFAVTTTGVHAYGGKVILDKVGLTEAQQSAFEQAHELKASGDTVAARDVLMQAGIDETTLRLIHQAKQEVRQNILAALEAEDYQAFMTAVLGTPLAEVITTEADFEYFLDAHELRLDGDYEAARQLLTELGIQPKSHHLGDGKRQLELSGHQRDALHAARQANNKDVVRAIYQEAGISIQKK